MKKKVMLSAIKPTNRFTLGNFIGALKNWVRLQNEYECLFFVVDLHAITVRQDPKILRENTYHGLSELLAAGLSPEHCKIFVQSHVSEHAELAWVIGCFSNMGQLNRMTQFKEKSLKEGSVIPTGLFTYPVLMAADILLYQTNLVPVGDDQKQHVELTRDLAERMNHTFGENVFTIPEPFIPPVGARIMNLQTPTSKMGKTDAEDKGVVYLSDSDATILKKIKSAVTDSGSEIKYRDDKPGVQNLLEIQMALTGRTKEDLENAYVGKQYGHLKVETADIVLAAIKPVREKAAELLKDRGELDRLLKKAADDVRPVARKTLERVYEHVGFLKRHP